MRKHFSRIAVIGLLLAVGFLLYVNIEQAQTIAQQRLLIVEMYQYIVQGCPALN